MSLDLDTLLSENKKIYVKNTSRPMGNIIMSFVTPNGQTVPRPIPRTWIPVCLTDTLSPDVIRQSNELRQFIHRGILQLVSPEDAQKELSSPEAQDEAKRLSLSEFSQQTVPSERIRNLAATQNYDPNINNSMDPAGNIQADPVNNRVKATLLRVASKDITERDAVAEFRVIQAELSSNDLTYIISSVDGEGPLQRFAFQLLAEINAVVDPDVVKNDTNSSSDTAPTDVDAEAKA